MTRTPSELRQAALENGWDRDDLTAEFLTALDQLSRENLSLAQQARQAEEASGAIRQQFQRNEQRIAEQEAKLAVQGEAATLLTAKLTAAEEQAKAAAHRATDAEARVREVEARPVPKPNRLLIAGFVTATAAAVIALAIASTSYRATLRQKDAELDALRSGMAVQLQQKDVEIARLREDQTRQLVAAVDAVQRALGSAEKVAESTASAAKAANTAADTMLTQIQAILAAEAAKKTEPK